MHYDILDGNLTFTVPALVNRRGFATVTHVIPEKISAPDVVIIADAYQNLLTGQTEKSCKGYLSSLRIIFGYMHKHNIGLPAVHRREWKHFVHDVYSYCFLDTNVCKGNDHTRRQDWSKIRQLFEMLIEMKAYPDIALPEAKLPKDYEMLEDEHGQLLGEQLKEIPIPLTSDQIWPRNYLVSNEYAEQTNSFLINTETKLRASMTATQNAAKDYWKKMQATHQYCRSIINLVDHDDLVRAINTPSTWFTEIDGEDVHVADARRGDIGLAYFLGAAEYFLFCEHPIRALTWECLRRIPFFSTIGEQSVIMKATSSRLNKLIEAHRTSDIFPSKMSMCLGLLTATDCAVAAIILINEHPRFTPNSLLETELLNKNNKSYIFTFNGHTQTTLSVNKRRARSRKQEHLNHTTLPIISYIIKATSRIRKRFVTEGHPHARYLFLISSRDGLAVTGRFSTLIKATNRKNLLYDIWKGQLEEAGLTRETFSLARIRNTSGILEWFRTKSIVRMAAKMGNSVKTILHCYIPPWVLRKMYENITRAFQQKLIILASIHHPWKHLASDFLDEEALIQFLRSTLIHARSGDKFTDHWIDQFRQYDDLGIFPGVNFDTMYINLSEESLALLMLFSEKCEDLPADVPIFLPFHELGISKTDLVSLLELIRSAVKQTGGNASDFAVKANIQGDSIAGLKSVWRKACDLKVNYEHRFLDVSLDLAV